MRESQPKKTLDKTRRATPTPDSDATVCMWPYLYTAVHVWYLAYHVLVKYIKY